MEEGEITEYPASSQLRRGVFSLASGQPDLTGTTYSPALEWPGDTEPPSDLPFVAAPHTPLPTSSSSPISSLRLLVQRSTVLRKPKVLALLDGYSEIQIGRDPTPPGSDTPKIRLKELEVSKLHATIYWDQERSWWSIVDMGSKHGTFIQPVSSASDSAPGTSTASTSSAVADARGLRLSAPRVASMPRTLHHLDHLTVGGTTFVVHIHEDGVPCTECSPQADEEIPLFPSGSTSAVSKKRKLDSASGAGTSDVALPRDPKRALAMLKRSLLSTPRPTSGTTSSSRASQYVDRSARRRALYPDHSPVTTPNINRSQRPCPSISASATPTPPMPVSTPPAPLPSSNIGHRLLLKQGWQPGSALGDSAGENGGLVAPLDPPATIGRAGLGATVRATSSAPAAQNGDWKDAGKKRRWAELRNVDIVS
ncbi:hypothetical protein BV20DRAFT_1021918 [Pilatotrama ljubarskyi]|nr:hypothetical protein BV20DRAFT_1021918 [Pilatotrama ljubarskyi]